MDSKMSVPFPSLSRLEEALNIETASRRPFLHPRVHSSPSLPQSPLPNGSPTGKARLGPLDLAFSSCASPSSPVTPRTPKKLSVTSAGSPYRTSLMLTPPLTPSSSLNSNGTDTDRDTTPSTPPDPGSPLRWSKLKIGIPDYLTPSSARSRSNSSDASMEGVMGALKKLDLTPTFEKTFTFDSGFEDIREDAQPTRFVLIRNISPHATTNLLRIAFKHTGDIKGIHARYLNTHGTVILAYFDLRSAIRAPMLLRGRTLRDLCFGKDIDAEVGGFDGHQVLEDKPLEARWMSREQLESLLGKSDFLMQTNASFFVKVEITFVQARDVQQVLSSFGTLKSFGAVGSDPRNQTFHVEYFDVRDAESTFRTLNDRTMLGAKLRFFTESQSIPAPSVPFSTVSPNVPSTDLPTTDLPFPICTSPYPVQDPIDLTSPVKGSVPLPSELGDFSAFRVRPRSVSASEGNQDAARRSRCEHDSPQSRELLFDDVGKAVTTAELTSNRRRSTSMGPEERDFYQWQDCSVGLTPQSYPFTAHSQRMAVPHQPYSLPPSASHYPIPHPHAHSTFLAEGFGHMPLVTSPPPLDHWLYPHPGPNPAEYYIPSAAGSPYRPQPPPTYSPRRFYEPQLGLHPAPAVPRYSNAQNVPAYCYDSSGPSATLPDPNIHGPYPILDGQPLAQGSYGDGASEDPSRKNLLDLNKIEDGADMRTTVMIKNIPNKMSDKDLLNFIGKVCPQRIDFMYLRMDFQNGCNVGYAFVNFITVQDLLLFAKTQLGVKWNMYSSEKVLQMSYATYQGKEALVEKFKNSCIMDEREAWRPKIFYSDGPKQGLPEPFPAPTHLRRKERSAHNRGALFVPGPHHQQRLHDHARRLDGDGRGPRDFGSEQSLSPIRAYHQQGWKQYPPRLSV